VFVFVRYVTAISAEVLDLRSLLVSVEINRIKDGSDLVHDVVEEVPRAQSPRVR